MRRKIKYCIFLLFNLVYKDGKKEGSPSPYFDAVTVIVLFEYALLFICLEFLDGFIHIYKYLGPDKIMLRCRDLLFVILLMVVNYHFLVRKGYFNALYREFNKSFINTSRNRKIGYACFILYWIVVIILIGNMDNIISLFL